MIDTIALLIPEKDFIILKHENFTPNSIGLFAKPYFPLSQKKYIRVVNNPTKKEKEIYGYLPRISLTKSLRPGGFSILMKIEFSIPKLLYGNNFEEVQNKDFINIVRKLKEQLSIMGVAISTDVLTNAKVTNLHYSKNFILKEGEHCKQYITEIMKSDINKWNDTNQTDFRNEGHSFKFHSNNVEVIFYDKLKDLEQAKKSDKRSIENDNSGQLDLLKSLPHKNEIFRMETRMNQARSIKTKFKQNNIEIENTFIKCFNSEYSMKILSLEVNKIISKTPKTFQNQTSSLEDLFFEINSSNPSIKFQKIIEIIGAILLQKEIGTKGFRNLAENKRIDWHKYKSRTLNIELNDKPTSLLKKILCELGSYNAIKLDNNKEYKELVAKDDKENIQ
mgnify:FL=1